MISEFIQQMKDNITSLSRNQLILIVIVTMVCYKLFSMCKCSMCKCRICKCNVEVEPFKGDNKPIFRMFHVKWCGHCKTAKPKFIEFMKNNPKINAELIDAEDETKKEVVASFEKDIEGYPTFILSKNNTSKVYDGERTVEGFEEFINNNY